MKGEIETERIDQQTYSLSEDEEMDNVNELADNSDGTSSFFIPSNVAC